MVEPIDVLDDFLFGNIWNNHNRHDMRYGITWQGDNYLVLDFETGEQHKFVVKIEEEEFDFTDAIKDQEWEEFID